MKKTILIASFCIMMLASCSSDEPAPEGPRFPVHLGSGNSDATTRVVTSESGPQSGQKHRSSSNFSTKGMKKGTHLQWCVPDGVSFDIMLDKTAASDPTCARSVTNGYRTPFTGDFYDTDRLYIANPSGAKGSFQVSYTVIDDNSDDVYVSAASGHSGGQEHRASSNFTLRRGRYVVDCPDGIKFSIMEDKSAASDPTLVTGLKNGDIIDRPQATNIYVADTKDASGPFIVTFRLAPNAWMKTIPGDKYLHQLSIPGTHDASTWLASPGFDKCQNYDFTCQLDQGIRYFDMRVDGNMKLRHNTSTYDYTLNQAFTDFINWLGENSDETIMVMVKADSDGDKVPDALMNKVISPNDSHIYRKNRMPALNEVRGKIVLLRRCGRPGSVSADNFGIDLSVDWPDDGCGKLDNGVKTYVEDRYYSTSTWIHDTNEKTDLIKQTLDRANGINNDDKVDYSNYLFLTFSSIACRPEEAKTPWDYAWGGPSINPYMNASLDKILSDGKSSYKRTGVVLMDFYNKHGLDDPYRLVDRIVEFNH